MTCLFTLTVVLILYSILLVVVRCRVEFSEMYTLHLTNMYTTPTRVLLAKISYLLFYGQISKKGERYEACIKWKKVMLFFS